MMVFHVGRIASKRLVSPSVTVLDLHVPSLDFFLPGQWVDFVSQEKKGWVGGFSLASSPRDLPTVTLAVKASSKAPAQWVTLESKVGDAVEIQVGGNCVLEKDFEKSAVFCGAGIGISPMLSMYRQHVQERGLGGKGASFLYIAANEGELVFVKKLVELASLKGDQLVVSLTQDGWQKPLSGVQCLTGRKVMHTVLKDNTSHDAIYYICGPPSMMDEAIGLLRENGISSSNIRYEKWW
jgi:ferredoxin-NADP reductase